MLPTIYELYRHRSYSPKGASRLCVHLTNHDDFIRATSHCDEGMAYMHYILRHLFPMVGAAALVVLQCDDNIILLEVVTAIYLIVTLLASTAASDHRSRRGTGDLICCTCAQGNFIAVRFGRNRAAPLEYMSVVS
ncbi:hypothetical protein F5Y14DRAFT_434062 [Nemania sp. NC0429]|nr:hypothetical protein F5Y14DRAFT_434062 [Nemania sp. NC0429]